MIASFILASSSPLDHVAAHDIFHIGPIAVNNHMIMATVAGGLMLVTFPLVMRNRRLVPSGLYSAVESVCVYFRDEVAQPFLHEHTDRFIGMIWTTFFFILFCNLLGIVPVASLVYLISLGHLQEVGGTATGNIYVTGALAGFMFIMIHAAGIWRKIVEQRELGRSGMAASLVGFVMYWYKLVPHIDGVAGIVLFPLLFLLEFLGVAVKGVALAIRLFANMIAGHILLGVLLFFISLSKTIGLGLLVGGVSVLGAVAISCLELFVAFLQAYIFTFLTTIFISMSVHQEH